MRARNIKPGLWKNEDLALCSLPARYLFPGLWCMADREGRLEDRPKRIEAELFPFDDFDVNALLNELQERGFIVRYEAQGMRCIQIMKFKAHQNPHKNENQSGLPAPVITGATPENTGATPADSLFTDSLFSDSLNPSIAPVREPSKPKQPRARDALFDAIAEITASDVKASGSHIGKVATALRSMEPPCTVEEVRKVPAAILKAMPYMAGTSVTLGMIEKHIGLVRSVPASVAAQQTDRAEFYRRQHDEAIANRAQKLLNQELNRQRAAREIENGTNATQRPGSGEGATRGNVAVQSVHS